MVKKFRPITPGQRGLVLSSFKEITAKKPCKRLLKSKKRINGRNNLGRITCFHRGGGHKRHYRIIDFKRDKENIPAKVASIEYDPNRCAFIALLNYADGEKRYILAPQGLKVNDTVITDDKPPFNVGCCMRLKELPLGSTIHNIELYPGKGGQFVKSAGSSAQLMARDNGMATITLPSGEVRLVQENCRATIGAVSNSEHNLTSYGKAGRMRWKGIRPTVRGVAMNPIDHPHGGGEGKSKGNHPMTPWGKLTKGMITRDKKKYSNKFIIKKRKKKKK